MDAGDPQPATLHMSAGGTSLVLDVSGPGIPEVAHWGAGLGDVDAPSLSRLARVVRRPLAGSGPDERVAVTLPPQAGLGYVGVPGLRGHRDGQDTAPVFASLEVARAGSSGVVLRATAPEHGLELAT